MPKALIVEILADARQFGRELDKAAGKTRAVGKVAGVAGLAIAGGLAYGLEKSVKSATEFQSSMQLLTTQAGVSEKSLGMLKQGVLGLAGPTATAPDELAKGLYHLASQGLKGQHALDALRVAAEGAKIGQADLEDVTNALGAAVASGIKGVKNLDSAMGSMNATVGAGDMRMQDLADAMGTGVLATAKLAGVGLRDVDAALAVFGDNNIRGAKAGTLVASALRLMSAPSKAAAKALGDAGINSLQLANVLRKQGLPAALEFLQKKMTDAGMSATQQSILIGRAFGGKQATGIKILLGQMGRLQNKEEEVGKGAAGFGQAWQKTSETTAFKFDQMKAAMSSVAVNLGSALLPAVTSVANEIAILTGWLSQHTTVAKIAVGVLGALAAILLTVSVYEKLLHAAQVLGIASTTAQTAASEEMGVAMSASLGPVGLVILGITALAVAFKVAWDHSATFRRIVHETWDDIKAVTTAVVGFLKPYVVDLFKVWMFEANTTKTVLTHLWDGIKGIWNSTIGAEIKAIISLIKTLISWAEKAMGILRDIGNTASHIHVPSSHGFKIPIPTPGGIPIPGLASGGIVTRPTLAVVGEAGPEAVIPLSSMSDGAGSSVTVNVGPVYGSVDGSFAQRLSRELATQLRGGRAPQLQQAIQAL